MKIVADENIAFAREFFADIGELMLLPGRGITRADVQDADVLLVRSVTEVNADLLQGTGVRFVGSCTIGTDHVDTEWLTNNNICFAYAPGCNAQAVVEYVQAALAALGVDVFTRQRVAGQKVTGQKIAVVGCGNVGGRLLRHLISLGADAVGCDPLLQGSNLPLVTLAETLSCDVICLHTPLTKNGLHPTLHLFDGAVIGQLKAGTVLLNAGRGAVIDNQALLQRLQQHNDLRVVLDVWENEPAIDQALLGLVAIGTPHIAGYSAEGKWRGTEMVYHALCDFLSVLPQVVPVDLGGEGSVYDIKLDDAALRTQSAADGAVAFDRLRKHYIPRREGRFIRL
jgi:erythronate-4-phosphate dehydrogenase